MESQQLLEITPSNSIKFEGTFKEVITKKLVIRNAIDKNVAFKIKTTTPRQYCVRPSTGLIKPHQTKEISIILQPMEYTINDKAKHKFMIQSLIVSEEESNNIDLVWKRASVEDIMCNKLLSVLVQTPEIPVNTEPEIVVEESKNLETNNLMSIESTQETEVIFPVNGISDITGDVIGQLIGQPADLQNEQFEKMIEENAKLKEQVVNLKKKVFDQSLKLETMQSMPDFDKDRLAKECPVQSRQINEPLGLPLIIYQLLAFFLGLIIGKFFL